MFRDIVFTLVRPNVLLTSDAGPHQRSGALACLLCGLTYGYLCRLLAAEGFGPSSDVGLIVDKASFYGVAQYYSAIIFFLPPLSSTLLVYLVGRKIGHGVRFEDVWGRLSLATGATFLVCFALPDLIAYIVWQKAGLKAVLPFVACITVYFLGSGLVRVVKKVLDVSWPKAVSIAFLAGAVQMPILTTFVR